MSIPTQAPTTDATTPLPAHLADPAAPAPSETAPGYEEAEAADFDLDAWIGAVQRPEGDVKIYNADPGWQERYEETATRWRRAEARLRAAVKNAESDDERSVTDLGPAPLEAALDEVTAELETLRQEREGNALIVRVRQLTGPEIGEACAPALEAGHSTEDAMRFAVASAIVSVSTADGRKVRAFTGEQLLALERRDVSGHTAVTDLIAKVNILSRRPSVPSSPESSTSRGTGTSSAR